MTSAGQQDDSPSPYTHHYEYSLQQQHAVMNSPATTLSLPSHVVGNSYAKFDDVRYSAVRLTPDEFVASVGDDGILTRGQGYQLHSGCLSVDNTSICTCVNTPCVSVKYAPHLTDVAELEMENLSSGNNSTSTYSCTA